MSYRCDIALRRNEAKSGHPGTIGRVVKTALLVVVRMLSAGSLLQLAYIVATMSLASLVLPAPMKTMSLALLPVAAVGCLLCVWTSVAQFSGHRPRLARWTALCCIGYPLGTACTFWVISLTLNTGAELETIREVLGVAAYGLVLANAPLALLVVIPLAVNHIGRPQRAPDPAVVFA